MRKIIMVVSILAAVVMGVLDFAYDDRLKPDEVYLMANRHIEWNYPGK